jgi:hypothetical protein
MNKRRVYTLERWGYFKEGRDPTDIFLELNPIPDFDPFIPRYGNLPPMYLAKRDNIVGTNGRFKKKNGNNLEYKDIEGMEVTSKMKVIRNESYKEKF